MSKKFYQGIYTVQNKSKYIGSKSPIYRSGWERSVFGYMDKNENIIEWGSEICVIGYYNPLTGKNHKYYPDIYCKVVTREKIIKEYVIEIKPLDQSVKPKLPKKKTQKAMDNYRKLLRVVFTNKQKWEAATKYCNKHGYEFKIITERELGF